jgi:hypothetical protein
VLYKSNRTEEYSEVGCNVFTKELNLQSPRETAGKQ